MNLFVIILFWLGNYLTNFLTGNIKENPNYSYNFNFYNNGKTRY